MSQPKPPGAESATHEELPAGEMNHEQQEEMPEGESTHASPDEDSSLDEQSS
jgi:hypothetical protein